MNIPIDPVAIGQGIIVALLGIGVRWLAGIGRRLTRIEKQIGNGPVPLNQRISIMEERQVLNHAENGRRIERIEEHMERRDN